MGANLWKGGNFSCFGPPTTFVARYGVLRSLSWLIIYQGPTGRIRRLLWPRELTLRRKKLVLTNFCCAWWGRNRVKTTFFPGISRSTIFMTRWPLSQSELSNYLPPLLTCPPLHRGITSVPSRCPFLEVPPGDPLHLRHPCLSGSQPPPRHFRRVQTRSGNFVQNRLLSSATTASINFKWVCKWNSPDFRLPDTCDR